MPGVESQNKNSEFASTELPNAGILKPLHSAIPDKTDQLSRCHGRNFLYKRRKIIRGLTNENLNLRKVATNHISLILVKPERNKKG